ncbi:MAG TPA: amino acid adenylation domain-containing protein, partial [Burkholderiaceae bacterium]
QRHGKTLSINWPLWAEGGMQVDAATRQYLERETGMTPLGTDSGLKALNVALANSATQIMVMEGDAHRLQSYLRHPASEHATVADTTASSVPMQEDLQDKATRYFARLLSNTLKMPAHRIDVQAPLETYGIDSVLVMDLTRALENVFGSLPKTLFFEYQTIAALTDYFSENHRLSLEQLLVDRLAPVTLPAAAQASVAKIAAKTFKRESRLAARHNREANDEIAIIGLAGRYPQAANLAQFWKNLSEGKDCITEIPAERWDHSLYFDEDRNKPGKTYGKWGGFIDGVDLFDPLFFNISPREAEQMDPQERLFLECVHATLEDAGYTRDNVAQHDDPHQQGNVGVFVGVMYEEYQLYGAQEQARGRQIALTGSPASIANRISYFCNFNGPSLAIDTMCSSSLTAIHLACRSLQRGDCAVAVAGGVNVSIHPNKYLILGQGKFISGKGRCESFGEGGEGYVPGEGVGAVLLKPKAQAIADGDHIYGVIKASAINHGGKTNGYTVPNPNAQAAVIERAVRDSGIDARSISYLEAHGTGTTLGDPIEIAGLSKAFRNWTQDRQFCAIGSAKSNIGHCESAAGIAGLTKVLLQMKHRQLVPSLHSSVLNPNIDFANTPFIVQQELAPWERPIVKVNGSTREYPRIAGISSFGAGGANAHVVIEEYVAPRVETQTTPGPAPALIVLSARNEARLHDQVQQLLAEIAGDESELTLADLAYTLQVGREAMDERLAMIVNSRAALREKLSAFIAQEPSIDGLYRGQVKRNKDAYAAFSGDEDVAAIATAWVAKGKFDKLLDAWTKGLSFDWNSLYGKDKPCRVSLPTYPFARERYWPHISEEREPLVQIASAALHPLLHRNTSDMSGPRFTSSFDGSEFFLADHMVDGVRVLPGAAQLEMARVAASEALHQSRGLTLKNVTWIRPIVVGDSPLEVHIALHPISGGDVGYEIYADDANGKPFGRGTIGISASQSTGSRDLGELRAQCSHSHLSAEQCYAGFDKLGLRYGPRFQGLRELFIGQRQALARITLPALLQETRDKYLLHPSLLDAALQASIGLQRDSGSGLMLPYGLAELEILAPCANDMWAYVRMSSCIAADDEGQILDIDLCDERGAICIRFKGFSLRAVAATRRVGGMKQTLAPESEPPVAQTSPPDASIQTLLLQRDWRNEQAPAPASNREMPAQHLLFVCGIDGVDERYLQERLPATTVMNLPRRGALVEDFETAAWALMERLQTRAGQPGRTLVQLVVPNHGESRTLRGLGGMLRSAAMENPRLVGQVIEVEDGQDLVLVAEDNRSADAPLIRYSQGSRTVACWSEIQGGGAVLMPWKHNGVYLITGGAGGLGLIFARDIAAKANNAVLILTGRSHAGEATLGEIRALEQLGAIVHYRQVDVGDYAAVAQLVQGIDDEFEGLNGILHAAGVVRDSLLNRKTRRQLQEVLHAKVAGTVNLDHASRNMALDCFICFSSIAGALGNVGQADYAAANAFMDEFAAYRSELVASGQRRGRTLSVNWPLWQDGGMQVDAATRKKMVLQFGMHALTTQSGLAALGHALVGTQSQVLVVAGEPVRIGQMLGITTNTNPTKEPAPMAAAEYRIDTENQSGSVLPENVRQALVGIVSELIKVKVEDIDGETSLSEYGFDSISLTEFGTKLNEQYKIDLKPTIFFEYPTLDGLAAYLVREHHASLMAKFGGGAAAASSRNSIAPSTEPAVARSSARSAYAAPIQASASHKSAALDEPIAIIGMSGQFPMARDIEEFWRNLADGKDCISEIPSARWNWQEYYGDSAREGNKTNIKWGGFIDGVDEFDPMFFGISPKEAELMDPQQRLMMMHVWKALEDAGYAGPALSGSDTAIFVGTGATGYGNLLHRAGLAGEAYASTGGVPSVGPNRLSYLFNWHGPSEPVETACSSSLVALRRGVLALQNGESSMAIVGGVNTIITPEGHISFSKAGMLSVDGRCKTFSSTANGYVRGEGAAMLVLKKLSHAERDGDHIYGLVRGTAENHGGRANSLTAPNPTAQANLLKSAYLKAGIDPRTVTYIEAHGTGTGLGDPVEINGLKSAFKDLYAATGDSRVVSQHCGLGSVKSNIGHLELAAGVAGVIKVLLQMKHKALVKSLHCDTLNPYIDFSDSPFYVVQEARQWHALQDDAGRNLPRRAGVSSFGFGGVNAHVVIEEYIAPAIAGLHPEQAPEQTQHEPQMIVLSARNEARLREQVQLLLDAIKPDYAKEPVAIADLAYTLQVGREAMEERLAFVVETTEQLRAKLESYLSGSMGSSDIYRGQARRGKDTMAWIGLDEDMSQAIQAWLAKGKFAKLLELWSRGLDVDWNALHAARFAGPARPRRVSLPTYPFARERYWVGDSVAPASATADRAGYLHPLLHANTSDLTAQRYTSRFDGSEFFLADHVVRGVKVLPGVAHLEMAYRAARDATHCKHRVSLRNVMWVRPAIVGNSPLELQVTLHGGADGNIGYKIGGVAADNTFVIHSQGTVAVESETATPGDVSARHVLAQLREQCSLTYLDSAQCYEIFAAAGLQYGPAFRGLREVFVGEGQALARITLPAGVRASMDEYDLHPSLLDAALQASLGLQVANGLKNIVLNLPFALEQLDVLAPCANEMWAIVRLGETDRTGNMVQKIDIDLCDETGLVCVRMKQFSMRGTEPSSPEQRRLRETVQEKVQETARQEERSQAAAEFAATAQPVSGAKSESAYRASANYVGQTAISVKPKQSVDSQLREKAIAQLKKLIGDGIKMPPDSIDAGISFEKYGIDSILVMELTNSLRDVFGSDSSISTTLFFEHQNIEELVQHLMQTEPEALMRWTGFDAVEASSHAVTQDAVALSSATHAEKMATAIPQAAVLPDWSQRFVPERDAAVAEPASVSATYASKAQFDIAIVGLSGRYPGAADVSQFWENLASGRNCISEVPPERWDNSKFFDERKNQPGKTYTKWAGLLDDVDCFDRLFFNITPREAQLMSPQERLFLQEVYASIEDAGYTPANLCEGRKIGMFVGVMNEHYATGVRFWSIANRISYLFNFQGPSMAVDTACSASLTAVHLAMESLRSGNSDIAIAGGVNLIVAPSHLLDMSAMTMLSTGDKCKPFAADGDGFVDSEAVGAVVLKPLHRAVADGDHIYGVIKGSAVNSGGKTNGYMVPNPKMQAQLVIDALQRAGVDARAVSYIEAQGTGSSLGDPIEIAGLSKAFRNWTQDRQFCAIGSAKSNVGHSESAAGIVAISKVLMQMKHRKLAPSLHSATLNPNINFANTPFVVQQTLAPWPRPRLEVDGREREFPRIAGISSFGAGGANAHLVIEEYIAPEVSAPTRVGDEPALIVMSARTSERLVLQAKRLVAALEQEGADLSLYDLAYTLQTGREAMEERLALVAASLEELRQELSAFIGGKADGQKLFRAQAKRNAVTSLTDDEDMAHTIGAWIAKGKFGKLLDLWVKGFEFDWNTLYQSSDRAKPRRISLPTYPFAREPYWTNVRYPDAPEFGHAGTGHESVTDMLSAPPSTRDTKRSTPEAREAAMLSIWQELFGRPSIDRHDDFFELGGHSLLATQLTSKIRVEFGVELPVNAIFEAPTVALLTARLALSDAELRSGNALPAIGIVSRQGPLPLSFAQQRLWFLDQFESRSAFYNIPAAVRLRGTLDVSAILQTINEIVRRHEALRTTFVSVDGSAMQVIASQLELALPLIDLSDLPASQREARARLLQEDEAQTPFDLANGPLVRGSLLRLTADDHVLLLTMHHIVSDGWSMGIVVREFGALYAAFSQNLSSPLAELAIQYADFAHWQRQWLSGDLLQKQLAYWEQHLAGIPSLLALPTDRPRPPTMSRNGATFTFDIPAATVTAIQAVGRHSQSTLFMVLSAAFNVLLARYSGQTDICIGTPIANRSRSEIESMIGFFVNTLVLRTQVDLNLDFLSLLEQVRRHTLAAYANQDVPFEQLVESLQPERHASYTPLFQVMFVLQNMPMDELALPGLTMQILESESATAKFDITWTLTEKEGRLQGNIEYNTDLFDRATIARMSMHFTHLLDAISLDPSCAVGDLPMLANQEKHKLLEQFNDTAKVYSRVQTNTRTLHQLFEEQVQRSPEHLAVCFEGTSLTYAELNARANRLAHYLRSVGVGPDGLVGLCMERSLEMIVGLYGILKAGGAYVPLDSTYPPDRLATILADAKPKAILTQQHLSHNLPALPGVTVLSLDSESAALAGYDSTNPENRTLPANLAYVIYTSGSTGKPKGVGIDQQGIVNRLQWMQESYPLAAQDRVLQKTPFTFDVSVWEFFWPLIEGSTLVVAKPGGHQDVAYLAKVIDEYAVTTMHFVPPMLDVFLNEAQSGCGKALRQVMCSGQALPLELQQRFFARWPLVALHNLYGPTEASVDVTYWQCDRHSALHCVPIGRPIANIQIHILDAFFNPVPVGVTGNLYIAGIGLARGYINRPDLTAQTFIPNPFSATPGARMYLSGDLARYLPDGNIEYLGRSDHQVKIRGLRIELGEIEAALGAQQAVRDVVVLACPDTRGVSRLVAYLVPHDGQALPENLPLRAALLRTLPDYMIPDSFIALDRMPLTSNGKVDRKALPAPDMAHSGQTFVAPRTPVEESIAGIWAQVLKLDQIGVFDDFFTLGGHSLLAITLIERMRRAGLPVDIKTFFIEPTVAALAAAASAENGACQFIVPANGIEQGCTAITPEMITLVTLNADELSKIVDAVPGGTANIQDIYPLSPAQEGILFHHLMSQERDAYVMQMLLAFDTRGRLDRFVAALQTVIARHDVLRSAVLWEELPQPVQVVWRDAPLIVEEVELDLQDDVVQQLNARFNPEQYRLDVRQAPLVRCFVAEDRKNSRWLMQVLLHHLIDDNTSLKLLAGEIRTILNDQATQLPEPLPFRNFVAQARLAVSESEHEAFFHSMLANVDTPTAPFGLLDVQGNGAAIAEARQNVEALLARRLRRQARALGVSPASVMHLAWAQVLAQLSGQSDVVFGTVLFGRMQGGEGADRVLGIFINTLPVCIRVGNRPVLEAVRDTHAMLSKLLRHEHASLALAQRTSAVTAPAPLFSALLNYRHNAGADAVSADEWEGMQVVSMEERTNYPCMLSVDDFDDGFALAVQIQGTEQLAQRVCGYVQTVLEGMANALESAPTKRLAELEVLPARERRQLLQDWNATTTVDLHGARYIQTMHQMVEAQVARTPDAVAVMHEGRAMSYAELNA